LAEALPRFVVFAMILASDAGAALQSPRRSSNRARHMKGLPRRA
jgi:hypothetical protein